MTHLVAEGLAGGRAPLPPLTGAEGGGGGALVTAAATNPRPSPPLPRPAPLLATKLSEGLLTAVDWVMDCLAAFSFSASCHLCHHFCPEETGDG